jgi:hypothetical protein
MEPRLGETIYLDLPPLASPTTGASADADSLPTARVFEDGSATAILTPTVVKRAGTTGEYYVAVACTAGNGFEADRSYNVLATATVGGVTASARLAAFQPRAAAATATLDLAQVGFTPRALDAVPDAQITVGDCLMAALVAAVGDSSRSGVTLTMKTPQTNTTIRTFTYNSATNPTSRS